MADIYLHNTLTGKKELFTPLKAAEVSIYNCGPTVYNYAHIGNFRTYVFGDILRRVFEYNAYKVQQVMNITDVDDKTIRGSKEAGISLKEFTRKYEDIFKGELSDLNVKTPTSMPRATEYIPQMISVIEDLLKKELAYATSDGVYFSIKKSPGYGALAHLDACEHDEGVSKPESSTTGQDTEKGHRIATDEYEKENAQDFALWKFHSEADGEVFWDASFGKGRPGWHIECSAMAMDTLGETIDIHTGASDLIFPHHTNEIAQSEGVTGKTFVNVWLHAGFLNIDSKKMAKSANNFYTLTVLDEMNISPLGYRYWLLTAHYRTQINFTIESVLGAQTALARLQETAMHLFNESGLDSFDDIRVTDIDTKYQADFLSAVNDDLNVSKALATAWELVKDKSIDTSIRLSTLLDFDAVFGLKLEEYLRSSIDQAKMNSQNELEISDEVKQLMEQRKTARTSKDWNASDRLRDEIKNLGYEIVDNADEQKIFKI